MSQSQIAESVGFNRQNLSDILRSNALKSLLAADYIGLTSEREEIEIESEPGKCGQTRFASVPLKVVSAYWLWQSRRGTKMALSLCTALIIESLEHCFEALFDVTRKNSN